MTTIPTDISDPTEAKKPAKISVKALKSKTVAKKKASIKSAAAKKSKDAKPKAKLAKKNPAAAKKEKPAKKNTAVAKKNVPEKLTVGLRSIYDEVNNLTSRIECLSKSLLHVCHANFSGGPEGSFGSNHFGKLRENLVEAINNHIFALESISREHFPYPAKTSKEEYSQTLDLSQTPDAPPQPPSPAVVAAVAAPPDTPDPIISIEANEQPLPIIVHTRVQS